jgi:hypothetical protein
VSNAERLVEIKNRLDTAFPGPWATRREIFGTDEAYPRDVLTAWVDSDNPKKGHYVICEHAGSDDDFIAHSRTDVEFLLDLVARYQSAVSAVVEMTPNPVAALQTALNHLERT